MKPVVVLPVSRPDYHLAIKLIRWMSVLATRAERGSEYKMIVLTAAAVEKHHKEVLEQLVKNMDGWRVYENPEAYEHPEFGYAAAASHGFKAGLEAVEKFFPLAPMLWVEADAVPTRPSWHDEIAAEYRYAVSIGKPVLADFHPEGAKPHCTGNAVYPGNWRELCPSFEKLPGPDPREGWDSSCRRETVPLSHRSATIQQVWMPPFFVESKMAMLHPETALFHRCKDSSLIDVLTERLGEPHIPLGPPIAPPTTRVARFGRAEEVIAPRKVEILIVSHRKDIEFLRYCLRAVQMYASGFSGVTLVVPASERNLYDWRPTGVKLRTHEEHPGKGNMDHCIAKCRADEICPDAEAILYLDSDCIPWAGFAPDDFLPNGKALCVRERFEDIRNPNRLYWAKTVEKALGLRPFYETMVRHPNIHFPGVLKRLRELVTEHTGREFNDYLLSGQSTFPGHFCEFDSMGAIAIEEFFGNYQFVDYDRLKDALECGQDVNGQWQYIYRKGRDRIVELWSHGGIEQYRKLCDQILLGNPPEFFVK